MVIPFRDTGFKKCGTRTVVGGKSVKSKTEGKECPVEDKEKCKSGLQRDTRDPRV